MSYVLRMGSLSNMETLSWYVELPTAARDTGNRNVLYESD